MLALPTLISPTNQSSHQPTGFPRRPAPDGLRPRYCRSGKERKELHKILEKELWVFGDEYTMLTSDKCPVTVDLPFCQWILLIRRVCHRSCSVSNLESSHSAAREAQDLDLQTSNHQVHRLWHSATTRTAELTASKIHWRKLDLHTDSQLLTDAGFVTENSLHQLRGRT